MSKRYVGRAPLDESEEIQAAIRRSLDREKGGTPLVIPSRSESRPFEPFHAPKARDCHTLPPRSAGHGVYACASPDITAAIAAVNPVLILDCRNEDRGLVYKPDAVMTQGPRSLRRLVARNVPKPPAVVKIAWPDFGLPPVAVRFFLDLAGWLHGRNVLCICVGGHGRSGTASAALLAAYGMDHPIREVRKAHCHKAVETKEQEAFVERVLIARRKGE